MSWIPCYHVFQYPVTMSWIPCYHVSYYPVPCLPLPCYHVSYYPVPCLPLLCYHVSYYPVSCLPSPCYYVSYYPVSIKECETTKKSWQVNHPKEPYPSKQLTCQLVYLFTRLLKISPTFHYLFFMNAAGLALVPKGCKSATGWSRNRGPLRYNWLPCWLYL